AYCTFKNTPGIQAVAPAQHLRSSQSLSMSHSPGSRGKNRCKYEEEEAEEQEESGREPFPLPTACCSQSPTDVHKRQIHGYRRGTRAIVFSHCILFLQIVFASIVFVQVVWACIVCWDFLVKKGKVRHIQQLSSSCV
ncbi:hypothetical protein JZ751_011379, partial [Albula glossodonta]